MKIRLMVVLVVAAFGVSVQIQAAAINVTNAGFEEPELSPAVPWSTIVPGWASTNEPDDGVFLPAAGIFTSGVPEGSQVAYVFGTTLSQVLSAQLAANETYTLSVQVGNRTDRAFTGYGIELWAGGTQLASFTDPNGDNLVNGEFVDTSVMYEWNVAHAASVAEFLEIRLLSLGTQVNFDDVRLDVISTPLPASVVLLASSLTGLGLITRRRKRIA